MATLRILKHPDPRLREVSQPIVEVTDEVRDLINDMAETMYEARGCGLAAPQVGINKRIFVIDVSDGKDLKIFINPQILSIEGTQFNNEGCLSFPNVFKKVKRGTHVHVQALDINGMLFELKADGLLAVAIQHETDHLDGVLMIDRKRN
jgi:peptide deformylase